MTEPHATKGLANQQSPLPKKQSSDGELFTFEHAEFSGPIPPPNILNQYPEDVRSYIINAASNEQSHRHALENKMIKTDSKAIMVGSYTTSIVCILAIIGGIFLVAIGKDGIGITTILAPVVAKGLQFLSGLNYNKSTEKDKNNKTNSQSAEH